MPCPWHQVDEQRIIINRAVRSTMYCRVNHIKYDASKKNEVISLLESQRETMMGLPGIQSVCTIETAPGELTSIAIYDTKEHFDAATPEVGKIMGGFAAFFTAPPAGSEGPTIFYF
ncbi:MAG: hypothetical protein ISP85_07595 [Candidatus Poseidonia sp.]|nr:hypothetical protein [Poseidonia sp.]